MSPEEIIYAHANKNGMDADILAQELGKFMESPTATVSRDKNCLFFLQPEKKVAQFYVLDGGSDQKDFISAMRKFLHMLKKVGFESAETGLNDKAKFKAATFGMKTEFRDSNDNEDPYIMRVKL